MRELNKVELQDVSGAGPIADAAKALGNGIGALIENFGVKGAQSAATSLGNGIGEVIEAGLSVLTGIFGGFFGRRSAK